MERKHSVNPSRLSRRLERWVYVAGGLLLVTGVAWLVAHYFLAATSEFGDRHHFSEPWWLRIHGAAAMGFLVVFGALMPAHMVFAWRSKKNRRSGVSMVAAVVLLVVTAYGLYYASNDTLRLWLSSIHWTVGLAATGVLVLHVVLGKRIRNHRRVQHKHLNKRFPMQRDSNSAHTSTGAKV